MDGHTSLAAALWAAALALTAKIVQDSVNRFRERRALATALAGEIGAYLDILQPDLMVARLRTIAAMNPADRRRGQKAFGPLPSTHPVFDQVGDRIGILPADLTLGISRFYNIITGSRLLITRLGAEDFIALHDRIQVRQIEFIADTIASEAPRTQALVQALLSVSREWYFYA